MSEGMESNKILEVTDEEGVIHLLINIKDIVLVADLPPPTPPPPPHPLNQNTP